jgi:WD40 repeat protein
VIGCAISPDGSFIVSASWDNTLKVWDAKTFDCLAALYTDSLLTACACSARTFEAKISASLSVVS